MSIRDVCIGLVLGLGIAYLVTSRQVKVLDARIVALDARAESLRVAYAADSARADSSLTAQSRHDATAERVSRVAENVRLGAIAKRIPAPCLTPGTAPADSFVVMVPLSGALAWKYAWEAERTARLHATKIVIPDLNTSIAALNQRIGVLTRGIALRDEQIVALKRNRKLGVPLGIGVGALLVLIIRGSVR